MNIATELQRLTELHQQGALTDEEFARAKAAILDGERHDSPEGEPGTRCYKCASVPNRACALCGHMFCGSHGGERWVWLSRDGSKYGGRNNLTKRVICDDCTPDPTTMKIRIVLAVVLFIAVLGIIAVSWLAFPRL